MGFLKGGENLQDGEEARSDDLEAAVGNRRTHPLSSNAEGKEDERKSKKDAREAMFMGTAKSNREKLVDIRKFVDHRWAFPKGTVGVGGRRGWEVEPS